MGYFAIRLNAQKFLVAMTTCKYTDKSYGALNRFFVSANCAYNTV